MRITVFTDNSHYWLTNNKDCGFIFTYQAPSLLRLPPDSEAIIVIMRNNFKEVKQICQNLRTQGASLPLMIFGEKISNYQKTELLRIGADDCLSNTNDFAELTARLKALARRPRLIINPNVTIGDLVIDSWRRRATIKKKALPLTPKEFMILEYLVQEQNRLVLKDELVCKLWDNSLNPLSQVISTHMHNLRKKLAKGTVNLQIKTASGRGYYLKNITKKTYGQNYL